MRVRAFQGDTQQRLKVWQQKRIIFASETDRGTSGARATGSTNTVNVIFRILW
jgi:hypothetical protein